MQDNHDYPHEYAQAPPQATRALNDTQQSNLGHAIIVHSALFIVGVFVLGLFTGHTAACFGAILTAGVSYVSETLQVALPTKRNLHMQASLASVAIGVVSSVILVLP